MDGEGTTLRNVVQRIMCFNQIMDEVRSSGGGGCGGNSSSNSDLH